MIDLNKLPEGMTRTSVVSIEHLEACGFNHDVASTLNERELTYEVLASMDTIDVFQEYLEWNGIIGYTVQIADALDNIRNVEAL